MGVGTRNACIRVSSAEARLGSALLSNMELVMASELALCGARSCFLKALYHHHTRTLGVRNGLLGLQRAPSELGWTLRGQNGHPITGCLPISPKEPCSPGRNVLGVTPEPAR